MVNSKPLSAAGAPLLGCMDICKLAGSRLSFSSVINSCRSMTTRPSIKATAVVDAITGGWSVPSVVTVKSSVLVAVFPPTVTVIVPVVAPAGTVVVMLVVVLAVTTADVPLN